MLEASPVAPARCPWHHCTPDDCTSEEWAMKPPETIETARLLLRQPCMEDAEATFTQYAQDPEVTRYLTWRPHASIETTRAFLRRCMAAWDDGSAFPWTIIRAEDN